MTCQDCNKKESTVHLTQIINHQKVVLNLCQDCAEKRGFHNPFVGGTFPLGEMLESVASQVLDKKGSSKSVSKCDNCGLTLTEFAKLGRFGCGKCYTAFRPQITEMLTRIHGSSLHKGQAPVAVKSDLATVVTKERKLEVELKEAIAKEDFEKAAKIRDQLKSAARDEGN